jgi:hypothetical protein
MSSPEGSCDLAASRGDNSRIDLNSSFKYEEIWRERIEPGYDRVIEALFDKIEATIQIGMRLQTANTNPAAGVSARSRPTSGSRMSGRYQCAAVPRTSERCLR